MRRRNFIALLGAVAARPLHAQPPDRMRRVGMLVGFDDPDIKAFQQELEKLGWSEGRNTHFEYRYAPAGSQLQALGKELVATQPEVIFAQSRPVTATLQHETHTIPIVFTYVIDPVGAGFVASFPHPCGNLTGFAVYEPSVVAISLSISIHLPNAKQQHSRPAGQYDERQQRSHHRARCSPSRASGLQQQVLRRGWWSHVLRGCRRGPVSSGSLGR